MLTTMCGSFQKDTEGNILFSINEKIVHVHILLQVNCNKKLTSEPVYAKLEISLPGQNRNQDKLLEPSF